MVDFLLGVTPWMGFIDSLYMRVILRRSEYTIGFIFSWGMVPLILMCLIYPWPSHGRPEVAYPSFLRGC